MANLGTRSVTLLTDVRHLKAGTEIAAVCWLNLDSYTDCAEVCPPDHETIPLGRITDGRWKYTDPKLCPHKLNDWNEDETILTCRTCGKDVT